MGIHSLKEDDMATVKTRNEGSDMDALAIAGNSSWPTCTVEEGRHRADEWNTPVRQVCGTHAIARVETYTLEDPTPVTMHLCTSHDESWLDMVFEGRAFGTYVRL